MKKSQIFLGAHISIAGGVFVAPQRGMALGCSTMQIFTCNQRQWKTQPLPVEQIKLYKNELAASPISRVFAHDSYLINLSSPDKNILQKSRESFILELQRTDALEIEGLIFHPGAHLDLGESKGLKLIAESINKIINTCKKVSTKLLLETTAGQGTGLGYKFEQLQHIIDQVEDHDRMGVCVDTCHIFAAGYDIRLPETYERTWLEFDQIIGLSRLGAIHLNDSKKSLGSRVDRHERIGKGKIGILAFQLIMNDPRLANIPKILEIPGGENAFKHDIDLLKKFVQS